MQLAVQFTRIRQATPERFLYCLEIIVKIVLEQCALELLRGALRLKVISGYSFIFICHVKRFSLFRIFTQDIRSYVRSIWATELLSHNLIMLLIHDYDVF